MRRVTPGKDLKMKIPPHVAELRIKYLKKKNEIYLCPHPFRSAPVRELTRIEKVVSFCVRNSYRTALLISQEAELSHTTVLNACTGRTNIKLSTAKRIMNETGYRIEDFEI